MHDATATPAAIPQGNRAIVEILRQLDDGLAAVPIYIITADDTLPAGLPRLADLGNVAAYTHAFLDTSARGFLESRGEWRGRGFAYVVRPRDENIELPDWVDFQYAVHEAGHWLCFASFLTGEDYLSFLKGHREGAAIPRVPIPTTPVAPTEQPCWFLHELDWIRASLHLRFRAGELGCPIPLGDLLRADVYEVSHSLEYAAAFRGELRARRGEPIRSILATDPPPAAAQLWQHDTAWFAEALADLEPIP